MVCKTCFELISCDLSFLYIQIGSTNKNTVNIRSICPPANSRHQDYYMFSIWKLKLNLYLPASWVGGRSKIYHNFWKTTLLISLQHFQHQGIRPDVVTYSTAAAASEWPWSVQLLRNMCQQRKGLLAVASARSKHDLKLKEALHVQIDSDL